MNRPRRALLIAFHFPPMGASSGVHRTLSLARYLQDFGWEPLVLTAHSRAYERVSQSGTDLLPSSLVIERAFALDAARHLSIGGRYPRFLALPDRWASWAAGALPSALRMIRRYRPALIWSTYPLATAHLVGALLHRLSGLPWIADFRDPMVELIDGQWFPGDPMVRRARLFVERRVATGASIATFCTSSAMKIFAERHGWDPAGPRAKVIENGFDPLPFESAAKLPSRSQLGSLVLIHSGTLYPGPDRDPSSMLQALANLRARDRLPAGLRVILRATGFDEVYRPIIQKLALEQVVELAPSVDYLSALREMMDADGLLLFQGHTSNPAVPAKAYEYLRARRPILALASEDGETVQLLRRARVGIIAPINDPGRIEHALEEFLSSLATARHSVLDATEVDGFSRIHRVREFAAVFDRVMEESPGADMRS